MPMASESYQHAPFGYLAPDFADRPTTTFGQRLARLAGRLEEALNPIPPPGHRNRSNYTLKPITISASALLEQ